jgi:hypothetical protein
MLTSLDMLTLPVRNQVILIMVSDSDNGFCFGNWG